MRYDEIIEEGLRVFEAAKIDKRWLDLGCETGSQNRINRQHIDSLTFEMRILGSEFADTRASLFGVKLPAPIMPAAIISSRVIDKLVKSELWHSHTSYSFDLDYMGEFARGVKDAESIMWWGTNSESELIENSIQEGAKVVLMIKPLKNKEKVLKVMKWAEKVGCVAVGTDIDSMFYEKAYDEYEGPKHHGPQSINDLKRYKRATGLPFVIKGVLSVHDAKIATEEIGAEALVVSHHGGEAIDYAVPVLQILPQIRKAVGRKTTIVVDTGMRRGTDVFKALALGANGVCFGSLMVLAFAAYGRYGVTSMLQVLYSELQRIMNYTGCKTVSQINPTIIHTQSFFGSANLQTYQE